MFLNIILRIISQFNILNMFLSVTHGNLNADLYSDI